MRSDTRRALLHINRVFYDEYADSFGASRQRPWEGWSRLLGGFEPVDATGDPVRILDVGCGNGRFGKQAATDLDRPVSYHGLDQSRGLLDQAREALEGRVVELRLGTVDLGASRCLDGLGDGPGYDVIGIFGVLHHLPGEAERRELLARLGSLLRPGGRLWASWWMLHETDRFTKKVVPWSRASPSPDLADLEPGDTLLSWQRDGFGLRYLHFPTHEELERLEHLPDLSPGRSFASDGPTGRENLYLEWTC